jgi:hypothetical protein
MLDLLPEANALDIADFNWQAPDRFPLTTAKAGRELLITFDAELSVHEGERSTLLLSYVQWARVVLGALRLLAPGFYWDIETRAVVGVPIRQPESSSLFVMPLLLNRDRQPADNDELSQIGRYLDVAHADDGLYAGLLSLHWAALAVEEAPIFHHRAIEAAVRSAAGVMDKPTTDSSDWQRGGQLLGLDIDSSRALMNRAQQWRHAVSPKQPVSPDQTFWVELGDLAMTAVVRLAKLRDPNITQPDDPVDNVKDENEKPD